MTVIQTISITEITEIKLKFLSFFELNFYICKLINKTINSVRLTVWELFQNMFELFQVCITMWYQYCFRFVVVSVNTRINNLFENQNYEF